MSCSLGISANNILDTGAGSACTGGNSDSGSSALVLFGGSMVSEAACGGIGDLLSPLLTGSVNTGDLLSFFVGEKASGNCSSVLFTRPDITGDLLNFFVGENGSGILSNAATGSSGAVGDTLNAVSRGCDSMGDLLNSASGCEEIGDLLNPVFLNGLKLSSTTGS